VRLTHVGGPTVLLEVAGWRILTDPTFDPPGRRYGFGWGTSSRKTEGPAVPVSELGRLDLVLLSHDHHADNLDDVGRQVLLAAPAVVTTTAGARRLGTAGAIGLRPWHTTSFEAAGRPSLTVTATPCRHGPPFSRPLAGSVVGFGIEVEGATGAIWMTGDTSMFGGLRTVPERLRIDTMLVHAGRVRFPITGPLTYSMAGADVIRLVDAARPRVVVPVHFDGWSHFSEQRTELRSVLDDAPSFVTERILWLTPGLATQVADPPTVAAGAR